MEPPSDAMLAGFQAHIEQVLEEQGLPPLRAEQWRTQLAKVKAARERMLAAQSEAKAV